MNVLGELATKLPKTRVSLTSHVVKRWKERIEEDLVRNIRESIEKAIEIGIVKKVDADHYKAIYDGKCIIFQKLSPFHLLAKTVYKKDERTD